MKKFSLVAVALLVSSMSLMASCGSDDDDQKINFKDTPAKVQEFVAAHFSGVAVKYVEVDHDSYDVELKNGFDLEFSLDGEWKKLDGDRSALPQSVIDLLPTNTKEYITQNYAQRKIEEISKKVYGYKVDFTGTPDIELVFDKDGNFVRIDK